MFAKLCEALEILDFDVSLGLFYHSTLYVTSMDPVSNIV